LLPARRYRRSTWGLVAEQQWDTVPLAYEKLEAIGQDEVGVKFAGDFDALGYLQQGGGASGANDFMQEVNRPASRRPARRMACGTSPCGEERTVPGR
jgi:hypothetical protein